MIFNDIDKFLFFVKNLLFSINIDVSVDWALNHKPNKQKSSKT